MSLRCLASDDEEGSREQKVTVLRFFIVKIKVTTNKKSNSNQSRSCKKMNVIPRKEKFISKGKRVNKLGQNHILFPVVLTISLTADNIVNS